MDWQFAAVLVICLITEQIEKLCVDHGDQEVKCTVRIAHDKEQRRFPVTQLVQFQLIVHGGIPDFLNIKGASRAPQEIRMDLAVLPAASL